MQGPRQHSTALYDRQRGYQYVNYTYIYHLIWRPLIISKKIHQQKVVKTSSRMKSGNRTIHHWYATRTNSLQLSRRQQIKVVQRSKATTVVMPVVGVYLEVVPSYIASSNDSTRSNKTFKWMVENAFYSHHRLANLTYVVLALSSNI
jgi:hypothetical protein